MLNHRLKILSIAIAIAACGTRVNLAADEDGKPPEIVDKTQFPAGMKLEAKYKLVGHTGVVRQLEFSPDGKQIATAGDDEVIYIWDPETGKQVLRVGKQDAPVLALRWSPDGTKLASGGRDGVVDVWDAKSGDLLAEMADHGNYEIRSLRFSEDGKRIGSVTNAAVYRIWDWENEALIRKFGPPPNLFAGHFLPGMRHYFARSKDEIHFLNTDDDSSAGEASEGALECDGSAPDGKSFTWTHVTGSIVEPTKVVFSRWDVEAKSIHNTELPMAGVMCNPDDEGLFVFLAAARGDVALYDQKSGKVVRDLTGAATLLSVMQDGCDGKYVAGTAGVLNWHGLPPQTKDFTVYVWHLKDE